MHNLGSGAGEVNEVRANAASAARVGAAVGEAAPVLSRRKRLRQKNRNRNRDLDSIAVCYQVVPSRR